MHLLEHIGEESLKAFMDGMSAMRDGAATPPRLPAGFDRGVLHTCYALAKVLDHGIETITFDGPGADTPGRFTLDAPLRDRIRELLGQPADMSSTAKTGRLEELNGHGGLTGRLWEADGTKWLCHFKPEHFDQLPEAWMRTVRVVGKAIASEARQNILEVESLVVLEEEISPSSAGEMASFWKSLPLDELAEAQGVAPVSDLDEISNLWPVDDDPDELLRQVLDQRQARRALAGGMSAP